LRIAEWGLIKRAKKIRNPKSAIRNHWADAFSAQHPYFQATSLLIGRKEQEGREAGGWIIDGFARKRV
jgi:hypothetical protein